MTEEIIKRKIELVKLKRSEFLAKNFKLDDDLLYTKYYSYDSQPTLIIPGWIDDILVKKLKINKHKKYMCEQIRIDFKAKFEKVKGEWIYSGTTTKIKSNSNRKDISGYSYENWQVLERYLRSFIDARDELREIQRLEKEEEKKKELCRLTKCFDDTIGTALCDCGWVNPAAAKFCAECGISLI